MSGPVCILIISHDVVSAKMAGPGIRYWELARVLGRHFDVTLAVPGACLLDSPHLFRIWSYRPNEWTSLAPVVEPAQAILLSGDILARFPELERTGVPIIVDGYDPHTWETLALFAGASEQDKRHRERVQILEAQCRAGDYFVCASERQRDWWLGLLEATGRIGVETYEEDPSLRNLVDVVPFGLRSSPPRHTEQVLKGVRPGIKREDKVVLWGGGLWQWLDPLTAVKAMALIGKQRDDVRLVFPGTRHPNPDVVDMSMVQDTVRLARRLGLLDEQVFFDDWVPYQKWPNYLLESDVGLSLHFDTVETRLAFRSRVLDYVWAGLPMVITQGDAIGREVARLGLGEVIDYEEEHQLADALLRVLARPRSELYARFDKARADLTWEKAADPLMDFCRNPRLAPDKEAGKRDGSSIERSRDGVDDEVDALRRTIAEQQLEMARLRGRVAGYERGRFIRLMKWLHGVRPWGGEA